MKQKDTPTHHGSSSIQLLLLSLWASGWWQSQSCSSRVPPLHSPSSRYPQSVDATPITWSDGCISSCFLSQFARVGNFCPDALTRMQTKHHLLSGLESAPFSLESFLSSAFISHSWCGGLSHSKLLLEAFTVLEAIVILNSLTSVHRADQSWQGASTTQGIHAIPSPTRTGQLLAVLKFFTKYSELGLTRNVKLIVHLTIYTGWPQEEGRRGDL